MPSSPFVLLAGAALKIFLALAEGPFFGPVRTQLLRSNKMPQANRLQPLGLLHAARSSPTPLPMLHRCCCSL